MNLEAVVPLVVVSMMIIVGTEISRAPLVASLRMPGALLGGTLAQWLLLPLLVAASPDGALSKTPGVAFVVLASEGDDARAERLRLDVSGWVLRSSTALDLREAVQAAAGTPGRQFAGERTACAITPRASEVVRLLAHGKPMKEVAADLGISTRTVAFHKYKTMRALGLDSSAALVRYAVRNHML